MRRILVFVLLIVLVLPVMAQGDLVHVTVQDNTVLRAGPGTNWDRLAVLPYGSTWRATARSLDGDWVQIAYDGPLQEGARTDFTRDGVTYGWVAYWLLVWTGDILTLPIDGSAFVPTARTAPVTMIISPDEYIYRDVVDPSTRVVGLIESPVRVEVTGRIGNPRGGFFWIQFKYNNEFYWTGTWATGVPTGVMAVPDGTYLYPFGRLLDQTRRDYGQARAVYSDIGSRWLALNQGQATTCNNIPDDIASRGTGFRSLDLSLEPLFGPVAQALAGAETALNRALAKFRAICGPLETRAPVTPEAVAAALADVREAETQLNTVGLLLTPFERRDPLLGR